MIRRIIIFFTPIYVILFFMLLNFCGVSIESIKTIETILFLVLFIPLYSYLIWDILSQSWNILPTLIIIVVCSFFWSWFLLGGWTWILTFALFYTRIKTK